MSRGLHCDQPAPREQKAPMASNPCNPGMNPHKGQPGTCHTVITVERGKKGEVVGGKQKKKKSTYTENNCLKKK